LTFEGVGVVAGGDDADLFLVELVETERRRRPADIDLARVCTENLIRID
jgi:hypothetical protein